MTQITFSKKNHGKDKTSKRQIRLMLSCRNSLRSELKDKMTRVIRATKIGFIKIMYRVCSRTIIKVACQVIQNCKKNR
jgi:hypothetical protein